MTRSLSTCLKATLTVAALACLAATQARSSAENTLGRVLKAQREVNHVAIQVRGSGSRVSTAKVSVDTRRGVITHILTPLQAQGQISHDNGRELRSFFPDSNRLIIQTSPAVGRLGVEQRIELIRTNYRVTLGERATIAGRNARQIRLEPIRRDLEARSIWYDEARFVPLKYQIGAKVAFETASIRFSTPSSEDFTIPTNRETETQRRWGPRGVAPGNDITEWIKQPLPLPQNWPLGFRREALHIVGSEEKPILAIRLTDGMAATTIYVWNIGHYERSPISGQPIVLNRLRALITGDAPAAVRQSLLAALDAAALWAPEQNLSPLTFSQPSAIQLRRPTVSSTPAEDQKNETDRNDHEEARNHRVGGDRHPGDLLSGPAILRRTGN